LTIFTDLESIANDVEGMIIGARTSIFSVPDRLPLGSSQNNINLQLQNSITGEKSDDRSANKGANLREYVDLVFPQPEDGVKM
jgi:hypothetical protein